MTSLRPLFLVAALAALAPGEDQVLPTTPSIAPPSDDARDDDAIVVTADRRENERERTTSAVAVVDEAELTERGHPAHLGEALRDQPGVQVQRLAGGVGSVTRVRIRGAQSSDTQVQIDGIPLNDPGDFNTSPDLSWLAVGAVESIELVKGAQSGLYGSRAAGGVVNVLTARPTDATRVAGRVEYGSYDTRRADAVVTGPIAGTIGYALSASGVAAHGFSAMTDAGAEGDDRGHEADGFRRLGANARIEAGAPERARGYLAAGVTDGWSEYDSFAGFPTFAAQPDDPLPREDVLVARASTGGSVRLHEDVVVTTDLAVTDYDREYPRETEVFNAAEQDTREWYGATRVAYEGIERVVATVGVDARRDEIEVVNPAGDELVAGDDRLVGVWAQALWSAPADVELSAVARRDEHSREGDATTWRVGAAWTVLDGPLTLLGAVATGFRAPSLRELYDPTYGDETLEAQESEHWEAGGRLDLAEGATLTSTWFDQDYTQKIGFDPVTFQSQNQPGARVEGLESAFDYDAGAVALRIHYTRTRSDDGTGQPLPDTPRHRAGASAALRSPGRRAWLRVAGERVGSREVVGTDLDPYLVVAASVGVWATRWLEVYARADNLLDERYETNPGFTTSGRAFYAGVGARW